MLNLWQRCPVATSILAAMLAASAIGLFVAPAWIGRSLFRPCGWLLRRDGASVVTSAFMHADLAHLLFNAFTFWAFAFGLEAHIGSARFAALYVTGVVVSAAGTWVAHRNDPGYASLGASGAILAVLFASIVYFPGASIYVMPIPLPLPAPLFAFGYLAYTLWAARRSRGRVNHDAHLGGALAGLAFVGLTDPDAMRRAVQALV